MQVNQCYLQVLIVVDEEKASLMILQIMAMLQRVGDYITVKDQKPDKNQLPLKHHLKLVHILGKPNHKQVLDYRRIKSKGSMKMRYLKHSHKQVQNR